MAAAQCVQMNAFQLQQLAQHAQQQQQQQQHQANSQSQQQNISLNSSSSQHSASRPIIERGASWSYNETRILLSLWGQDMVQRQLTNSKRTRHVWEKIAERIREHGFERTADQVRTRVFNMIAEYRRILKNPSPERQKKCIFFDALHKIYQAKDTNGVKAALNNYEEDYHLDIDFSVCDENQDQNGGIGDDSDGNVSGNDTYEEESEVFAYAMSPSAALGSNGLTNGHSEHDVADDSEDQHDMDNSQYMTGPPPTKRLRSESTASMHIPYHNFDNSSAALLIDRMFAHLAKETEVMREWVCLERERLKDEVIRRKEEVERDERRERAFLSTLSRMQEQMFSYLSKQNVIGNASTVNTSSVVSSQSSPCNNNSDEIVESEIH